MTLWLLFLKCQRFCFVSLSEEDFPSHVLGQVYCASAEKISDLPKLNAFIDLNLDARHLRKGRKILPEWTKNLKRLLWYFMTHCFAFRLYGTMTHCRQRCANKFTSYESIYKTIFFLSGVLITNHSRLSNTASDWLKHLISANQKLFYFMLFLEMTGICTQIPLVKTPTGPEIDFGRMQGGGGERETDRQKDRQTQAHV